MFLVFLVFEGLLFLDDEVSYVIFFTTHITRLLVPRTVWFTVVPLAPQLPVVTSIILCTAPQPKTVTVVIN